MGSVASVGRAQMPAAEDDGDLLVVLHRIARRLDALDARLDLLETRIQQTYGLAGLTADTLDDMLAGLVQRGIQPDQRVQMLLDMLEHVTRPATHEVLVGLLDRVVVLEKMLAQMPGLVSMSVDTLDGVYAAWARQGVDVEMLVHRTLDATRLLIDSGILGADAVRVVSSAASALAASSTEHTALGPWGLWRALSDPNVQRTLGFLVSVGKHFGGNLREQAAQ